VRARALLAASWLAAEQGDCAEADRLGLQALELCGEVGDVRGAGEALNALGWSAERSGDIERATHYFEESYRAFSKLPDESLDVLTTIRLARWLVARGDFDEARRLYVDALRTFERHGLDDGRASTLIHLGGIDEQAGDLASARRMYEESCDVSRRVENKRVLAEALTALARVDAAEGLLPEAGRAYAEAVSIRLDLGDRSGTAHVLERLAAVALSDDAAEPAAQLLGAARTQRAACGGTATQAEAEEAREIEQSVRAVLGASRFEEEAETGAAFAAPELKVLAERITRACARRESRVSA
jgi:tetratricopeptide (TPR) repeat protein